MRKVEHNLQINASPEKVIEAFVEFDMLKEWWGVERSLIEKREGGLYTFAWGVSDKGYEYITSGIISRYDPRSVIEIDKCIYMGPERPLLGPVKLTIEATENNRAADVHIVQDGYRDGEDWDWYYEAVAEGWPRAAADLKTYLEKQ
ncbi:MAG: SRPBCC domain-containing protein [Bacteroidetes bacterium]|nr:SRPBCC domain-containing protein [Bacteroidota bacterium]